MRLSRFKVVGKTATRLAIWGVPPQKGRVQLSNMNRRGYISASAKISHSQLTIGGNVFIDDGVEIFQSNEGGAVDLGDRIRIYRDTIIETGLGGRVKIGDYSSIHPRCQINAYAESVLIGSRVMIAANCAFYPYDHGIAPNIPISKQPLQSKGSITIKDGAWLGYGVIVLSGVTIGEGAVVGAGSVVINDIPDGGVAVGSPARVIKMRTDAE
jgi:acetyltransferase-like isoleucine patch superfamily enzyme